MDPRMITALIESPGWKVLREHLLQSIADSDEQLISANVSDEARRLQFAHVQGYREAMLEILQLPSNPRAVRQNSDPSPARGDWAP